MLDDPAATDMVTDPSKIWWDIRPSARHPMIDIRICDVYTWYEDGLAIANLFQSILTCLSHFSQKNERRRHYRKILLLESKWRVKRSGVESHLGDYVRRASLPFAVLICELIEILRPYAEQLGSVAEVEHARAMASRGTHTDHQLKVYRQALESD